MKNIFKKIATMFTCLALVLCVGLSLTACGKKEDPQDPPPAGTITISSTDDLNAAIGNAGEEIYGLLDKENEDEERHNHPFTDTEFYTIDGDEVFGESDYFIPVATLSGFGTISKVKLGTQEFGSEDTYVSLGNNHFIQAKAWKVEGGKLYVAFPVAVFEFFAGEGKITINGVTATCTIEMPESQTQIATKAFSDAYAFYGTDTSTSTVTKGNVEGNVLNTTIDLKDGKQAVALEYGESENVSKEAPALVKIVKDGKVSYALSNNEELNGKVVLGVYPVAWKADVTDVATEYAADIGKTVEVSAFAMKNDGQSGTIYNAKITITNSAATAD